jgi:hypothetical protein
MKSHEPKKWGQNKGKNRRMKRKKGKNIDKKIVKDKESKIKVLTHELLASTLSYLLHLILILRHILWGAANYCTLNCA